MARCDGATRNARNLIWINIGAARIG